MQEELKPITTMDHYLQLVDYTEPSYLFHRWCFLSIVAASLGRNFFLQFGEEVIYPNMYTFLIGPPASRKSTAINIASKLLSESGYQHVTSDRSSKEKFAMDWEHGFDKINRGVEPGSLDIDGDGLEELQTAKDKRSKISEVYIKAGEFQDFIGSGGSDFVSLLTNLWDNLPYYGNRFKNSKSINIANPTINILGGLTSTSFAEIFSSHIIGQGMFSRMLLINGKKQRRMLTIPPPLDLGKKAEMISFLLKMRTYIKGAAIITPDAMVALDWIYKHPIDLKDSRLLTYGGRRFTHLVKLCLVITASELSTEITRDIVITANTILTYTERYMSNALGEFGKAKNSDVAQSVLDVVVAAEKDGGTTIDEILSAMGQNIDSVHTLGSILEKLMRSGRVESRKVLAFNKLFPAKNGYPNNEYLDFSQLWEFQTNEGESV